MNAVTLIQLVVTGDALQEKRHQSDAILLRELGIHLMKRDDVAAAVVRRRFHAGKNNRDVAGLGLLSGKEAYLQARAALMKALAIDPNYVLVREYLGEGYIAAGKIGLAKAQLTEIASRCGTTCEEYQDLAEELQKIPN